MLVQVSDYAKWEFVLVLVMICYWTWVIVTWCVQFPVYIIFFNLKI